MPGPLRFAPSLRKQAALDGILSRYFFFQAEDGIRDAQESRGLGDVYKRQLNNISLSAGKKTLKSNSVESAFKTQSYMVKNTLCRTAFSANLPMIHG